MDSTEGKTEATQSAGESVPTKLGRIADKARKEPGLVFTSLGHCLSMDLMTIAYERTRKDGAIGVDEQTAEEFAVNLEENLQKLVDQAKSGTYFAPPVRRKNIPKEGTNKVRPIGIPTFGDKVLQRGCTMILNAVYEQDFLECAHGFRPKRSAHTALAALWDGLMKMGGGWVYEVDIKSFFDTLDHKRLREFLDQRVRDGVLRRLINKWLKAGVMEDDQVYYQEEGTPQGGVISPLLANIYLHEVVDKWFEREVKPRLRSKAFLIRFADDFVIVFQSEADARRVEEVLPKRMAKYGLRVSEEKTRLIEFRRPRYRERKKRNDDFPTTFDFLGFTHYWGKSRKGNWVVMRKTGQKKFVQATRKIYQWCRKNRHLKIRLQYAKLCQKVYGHYSYYGITGNIRALQRFCSAVKRIWKNWLNRRSQRRGYTWRKFEQLEIRYELPRPRVVHSVLLKAAKP